LQAVYILSVARTPIGKFGGCGLRRQYLCPVPSRSARKKWYSPGVPSDLNSLSLL